MVKVPTRMALLALGLSCGCDLAAGTVLRLRDRAPVGPDGAVPNDAASTPTGDGAPTVEVEGGVTGPGPGVCRITGNQGFVETFTGDQLDNQRWLVAHGNEPLLGERSLGGFSRDNVRIEDNKLWLTVRGDQYAGNVRGFAADGSPRSDGKRTGAAIATRDLFMSATYQWEGVLATAPGVKLMLSILRSPSDDSAVAMSAPGLDGAIRSYGFVEAVVNPGLGAEQRYQVRTTVALDDGTQQSLRIDWHAGGPGIAEPFIDFWQEAGSLLKVEDPQPSRAGRVWLSAFVPEGAPADFDSVEVPIETMFITTFAEGNDRCSDGEVPAGMLVTP
jgi:hypothetical protein